MPKLAKVTKSETTGKAKSEASGQGREGLEFMQMGIYGFISRPPIGSVSVLLPLNGDDSNNVGISDAIDKGKMPDLAEGECAFGVYASGSYIHFKADGTIIIKGKIIHEGGTDQTGTLTNTNVITDAATIGGKVFATHAHTGVQGGLSNTGGVA